MHQLVIRVLVVCIVGSLAIVPYSPAHVGEGAHATSLIASPSGGVTPQQNLSPTASYMEDLASEEKIVEVPSNKEQLIISGEVSSNVEVDAPSFEHLWADFQLPAAMKELLNAYARVDRPAFVAIEQTELGPFLRAKVESLGQILTKLASWSFEVLLSDELNKLKSSLSELERYGVPCAHLRHKMEQLQLVKPAETKVVLSDQARRYESLLSQVNACARRRDVLDKKIEELQAEIDNLLDEKKTSEVLLEALEKDLAQVETERTETLKALSQYFPGENPITVLSSVRDFFSL